MAGVDLQEFADRSGFQMRTVASVACPQRACWYGMHQDYSEGWVGDSTPPAEDRAGHILVKHLLRGKRGHYGPLEHASIVIATKGFPHTVMQQMRTHRIGVSFDVQSGRYTGTRIAQAASDVLPLEEVFYFRPVGSYTSRTGDRYEYTEDMRAEDMQTCDELAYQYLQKLNAGFSEEHARDLIPYAIRQNFVVSMNLRSGLHLLDLRHKPDAQLEAQAFAHLLLKQLRDWAPEVMGWYEEERLNKGVLAP